MRFLNGLASGIWAGNAARSLAQGDGNQAVLSAVCAVLFAVVALKVGK